jgi:anti-sigma regulatory factor (Ser/Thr protein kinase)
VVEPPWLRLTRISTPHEWDDLQNELLPVARELLGDYELTRRTLYILGELVDNAATHGQSDVGTLVCAQRYSGATSELRPGVWMGIADGGVGIPDHLRRNPKYAGISDDQKLIGLARQEWVTGTSDRRGWGLVEVFENATDAGPSEVVIRSGRGQGQFKLRPQERLSARYGEVVPPVGGTWIHIRVDGG